MTISYELALELKKAGWPQPSRSWAGVDLRKPEDVYIPDLEELIAACPRQIEIGWGNTANFRLSPTGKDEWMAAYGAASTPYHLQIGATPEEAVTRLLLTPEIKPHWLALQKAKNEQGD